jgi:hypothetical protein
MPDGLRIKQLQDFMDTIRGEYPTTISLQELSLILNCSAANLTHVNKYMKDEDRTRTRFGAEGNEILQRAFSLLSPMFGSDLKDVDDCKIKRLKYCFNNTISPVMVLEDIYVKKFIKWLPKFQGKKDQLLDDIFFKVNSENLKEFFVQLWCLIDSKKSLPIICLSGVANTGKTDFVIENLTEILYHFNLIENPNRYMRVGSYLEEKELLKNLNEVRFLGGILQINESSNRQHMPYQLIVSEIKKITSEPIFNKTVIVLTNYVEVNEELFQIAKMSNEKIKAIRLLVRKPAINEIADIFPQYLTKNYNKEITKKSKTHLNSYFHMKNEIASNETFPSKFSFYREMRKLASSLFEYKSDSLFPDEIVSIDVKNCNAYKKVLDSYDKLRE